MTIKDYTCSCGYCARRSEKRFRLPFGCYTCGTKWVGEMRFGDDPPTNPECTGCGGRHTFHQPKLLSAE